MMKRCYICGIACALGITLAAPAVAEATGGYSGLGKALTQLFFYALAYLALLIGLIVMAIRRKWSGFRRLALIGFAVAVLYPLADSSLLHWQKAKVAAAEIRKERPELARKSILFIPVEDRCYNHVCKALIELREGAPLWTIAAEDLVGLDFYQPIDLATVPLSQWRTDPEQLNSLHLVRSPDMPRPVFDYLIVSRQVYYKNRTSPIGAALPLMPKGTFLGDHLSITDLAAPIKDNQIDLNTLLPDLLTLYNARKAQRVPLFVENTIRGSDRGWRWRQARAEWYCAQGNDRTPAEYSCENTIK